MKKQEENKNINNKEVKNSFKVKKCEFDYHVVKESDYYVMNSNVNFYEVNFYNQENKKSDINFVTILIIQCCDCHKIFNFRNSLFHHLYLRTAKITHCLTDKKSQSTVMLMKFLNDMLIKFFNKLSKIMSTDSVTVIKDIETDYEFYN